MIIQNTSRLNPDVQRVGRANEGVSGGAAPSNVDTRRVASVELPLVDVPASAKQATVEQVRRAAEVINKTLRQSNRNLEFRLDEGTNRVVVKLTDTETGELIRQVPSEEMLAISRAIGEFQQGLLLRQKA